MNKSISKIPCTLDNFFKYWLMFTAPMHKLPPKDLERLSYILKKRYELGRFIVDDSQIDKFLFSTEIREEIIEESGTTKNIFQVTLSRLRKRGVITDKGDLNKRFIPDLAKGTDRFDLMILFDIKDNVNEED